MGKVLKKIISEFKIIKPKYEMGQDELIHYLLNIQALVSPNSFDERILKTFSVKKHYISKRSFFNQQAYSLDFSETNLYCPKNNFSPNLKERSLFFQKTVDDLFDEFFNGVEEAPDDLIHVTCTGYVSPSAGQKIIPKKNWSKKTELTQVYHMGCYASIPALKIAKGIKIKRRVDIVHTELCSLHFDVRAQTPEQAVVQTLFSDGAIKYSVFPEDVKEKINGGLLIIGLKEEIIPGTQEAMTWTVGDFNFEMTLHHSVPSLIKENLETFVKDCFTSNGYDFNIEKDATLFAIHPGGPKIIDQIVNLLGLNCDQVRFSKEVLFERGNMSSATLPHVWEKIVNDPKVKKGTKIFSVAFGPGLTIAGFLGEKI